MPWCHVLVHFEVKLSYLSVCFRTRVLKFQDYHQCVKRTSPMKPILVPW